MSFKKTFALVLILSFYTCPTSLAKTNHVVINEIQIDGVTSKDEFIELFNPTGSPVNLTGWRLAKQTASGAQTNLLTTFPDITLNPNQHLLIAHPTGYTGSISSNVAYSTQESIASNNTLILYSDAGKTTVDLVGLGEVLNFEGASVENPPTGQSIERRQENNDTIDTDNNKNDFFINSNPSPTNSNTTQIPDEQDDTIPPPIDQNQETNPPTNNSGTGSSSLPKILINEFVADPSDGENEWVELTNKESAEIDLTGWALADGSEQTTLLSGRISAGGFFVVEKPKGNLNNSGDIIILKNQNNTVINKITYGNWNDGNIDDNAPVAKDPFSVARNNLDIFEVTSTPTKNQANIFPAINPNDTSIATGLFLSELLPNPNGDDSGEFIEIFNSTNQSIDADRWRLENSNDQIFTLDKNKINTIIPANGYLILERSGTNFILNNQDGETVKLFEPNGKRAVSSVTYKDDATNDLSYAFDGNTWHWTTTVTKGAKNIITPPNRPPLIKAYFPTKGTVGESLIFSAEDTFDPDGDAITYLWQFGDQMVETKQITSHIYTTAQKFSVVLEVKDKNGLTSTAKKTITIASNNIITSGEVKGVSDNNVQAIIINEILPAPSANETEWLELFNPTEETVSLAGWQLSDASNKIFTVPDDVVMAPNDYLVFSKSQTKISLNNDGDILTLLNTVGEIIDEMTYTKTKPNFSLARNNASEWQWTSILTPQAENQFDQSIIPNEETASLQNYSTEPITINGLVSSAPGEITNKTFYLSDIFIAGVPPNIRIDLPEKISLTINRGNTIEVFGKIKKVQGELRFNVEKENDIKIINNATSELVPTSLEDVDLTDDLGSLVTTVGTIQKGNSNGFVLELVSGDIIRAVLPPSIKSKTPYPTGTIIKITGILSHTNAGPRILVRDINDLIVETPPIVTLPTPTLSAKPWYESYITITLLGFLFLAGTIIYKLRQNSQPLPIDIIDEEDTV